MYFSLFYCIIYFLRCDEEMSPMAGKIKEIPILRKFLLKFQNGAFFQGSRGQALSTFTCSVNMLFFNKLGVNGEILVIVTDRLVQ